MKAFNGRLEKETGRGGWKQETETKGLSKVDQIPWILVERASIKPIQSPKIIIVVNG